MRIRNMRKFELYFPYAGIAKGNVIRPAALSVELPTDRFYNVLLQRDWKRGLIEIELNDMDRAILGEGVTSMFNKSESDDRPVMAMKPAANIPAPVAEPSKNDPSLPAPSTPSADLNKVIAAITGESAVTKAKAAIAKLEAAISEDKAAVKAEATPVAVVEAVPLLEPQDNIKTAVAATEGEAVNVNSAICMTCKGTKNVSMDTRVKLVICKWCKRKITNGYKIVDGQLHYAGGRTIGKVNSQQNPSNIQPKSDRPGIPKPTIGKVNTPSMFETAQSAPDTAQQVPGMPTTPVAPGKAGIADLVAHNKKLSFGPVSLAPKPASEGKLAEANEMLRGGPIGSPLATMSRPPKPQAHMEA